MLLGLVRERLFHYTCIGQAPFAGFFYFFCHSRRTEDFCLHAASLQKNPGQVDLLLWDTILPVLNELQCSASQSLFGTLALWASVCFVHLCGLCVLWQMAVHLQSVHHWCSFYGTNSTIAVIWPGEFSVLLLGSVEGMTAWIDHCYNIFCDSLWKFISDLLAFTQSLLWDKVCKICHLPFPLGNNFL